MKSMFYNIKKTALGLLCVGSLFLACSEGETALSQIIWSSSMLAICYASGKLFVKKFMTKEELEERV